MAGVWLSDTMRSEGMWHDSQNDVAVHWLSVYRYILLSEPCTVLCTEYHESYQPLLQMHVAVCSLMRRSLLRDFRLQSRQWYLRVNNNVSSIIKSVYMQYVLRVVDSFLTIQWLNPGNVKFCIRIGKDEGQLTRNCDEDRAGWWL